LFKAEMLSIRQIHESSVLTNIYRILHSSPRVSRYQHCTKLLLSKATGFKPEEGLRPDHFLAESNLRALTKNGTFWRSAQTHWISINRFLCEGQIDILNDRTLSQYNGLFQHVLQFTNIPGPLVVNEARDSLT
jgi:hypothetical protein